MSIFRIDTKVKTSPYKLLVVNREAINANRGIIDINTKELIIEILGRYLEYTIIDMVLIG